MEDKRTKAELEAHLADVEKRFADLAAQFDNRDFTEEAEAEWEACKEEIKATKERIAKREKRERDLAEMATREENLESEQEARFSFQVKRQSVVPDDPTKLEEYRVRARSLDDLERGYRDGAKKILETRSNPALAGVSKEEFQNDVEPLVDLDREVALRMIVTSTPAYKDEFKTYVQTQGNVIGPEMQRAASLTTTAGGFAVPVELDTTLMITNAGAVNPIRQLARVRQTNANTYEFLNTTGITAGFGAEATEASDNAPTLAQPTVNVEKAFAFVPMSIEIAEDWANIQADLAAAFADAKNRLESTQFLTGLGHASNAPQGLIAVGGATSIYTTATTAVFAIADLYGVENQLSPRYRANASFAGSKAVFQKIRQFDTGGGASLWTQLQFGEPANLLGYPAYEWSSISSAVTTSGSSVLIFGDFNYFGIVDRAGLNVEFIPHMFGSSNRYPTGQRGLYAWWRTSSQVLSPVNTVSTSAFQTVKIL